MIGHLSPRLTNQTFEAERVNVLRIDTQRVARRLGEDQPPRCSFNPVGLQHLTKLRNVDLTLRAPSEGGWSPQSSSMIPIRGEHMVGVDHQQGKQRLGFRRPQLDNSAQFVLNFERAQGPHLHNNFPSVFAVNPIPRSGQASLTTR